MITFFKAGRESRQFGSIVTGPENEIIKYGVPGINFVENTLAIIGSPLT
jgi:hypothetical protein